MAQTKKSASKSSSSRNGSGPKPPGASKSAASKRSSSSSKGASAANGNKGSSPSATKRKSPSATKRKSPSATKRKSPSATKRKSPSATRSAASQNGADSIKDKAVDISQTAGQAVAVAGAASKAKTPLIAGGTALAGAAVGVLVKSRLVTSKSKNPLKRLGGVSMPKPATKLDLGKLDLEAVKTAGERVSAYGKQASDIAAALEKTRKKNG